MSKSRSYCFTINNYTIDDEINVLNMCEIVKYLVVGFEKGEQDTPHMQGYLYFPNAVHFNSVKNDLPRAHIEVSKGNPQQNYDYCTKDGDYFQFGELPVKGRATWDKIEEAMRNPKDNIVLYNQYHKAYTRVINSQKQDKSRDMYMLDLNYKYEYLGKHSNVSIYPSDYDGEDILMIPIYTSNENWINDWWHGYPHKEKVGYEYRYIDPSKIVFLVDSKKDINYFMKKFDGNLNYISSKDI